MKPKYMLDTNICIYLMKNHPVEVKERFDECFVGDVVISAITLAELEFGIACSGQAKSSNRSALDAFLEDIPVAPFGADAARSYGPIRAANRDRARGALDKLIAAHAISLEVILVTNNEADFATYQRLTVENWVNNH